MELRHLRYFVSVAEQGGFLKAAGQLRVAQSALSKQIRDLEREVGVALFVLGWRVEGFDGHRLVSFEASGVLLPASHPLAVKQTIHLSELRDLTFLHLAGQHWPLIYGSIHRALRERGLVPARVRAVSIDSASVHLAAGDAWALASDASAAPYRASTTVVYRPFLEAPIPGWPALVWPRETPA